MKPMSLPLKFSNPRILEYGFLGLLFTLQIHACHPPAVQNSCDMIYSSEDHEEVKAVKEVFTNMAEPWNKGITDYFYSVIDKDAITLPPNTSPAYGKQSRINGLEAFLNKNISNWQLTAIDNIKVSGGLAFVRTKSTESWSPKDTKESTTIEGQEGFWVLQKGIDGKWQIIFEAWYNPEPTAADEL